MLKLRFMLVLIFTLLGVQIVSAQEYDHFIRLTQTTFDAAAAGVQPGDVVCLEAGIRTGALILRNFQGTAEAPVLIKNCGGKTVFSIPRNPDNTRFGYGVLVLNSSHIRLTGSGDTAHTYGIDVSGPVMGVSVGGLSEENIEVDHISVHDVGFAGIMVKTDPTCDPATWRENFEMRNVRVHDNYVYFTEAGEGFYIGFTFSDGYEITCDGEKITVYGHLITDLEVYNNRTEDTGSEGIQIGSSPGARIHHNVVIDAGVRPFADFQNNGVQIGYHEVTVYNNWVQDARAVGLIFFGTGHAAYNNVIVNAGSHGTYADDRAVGSGFVYLHNTVVNAGADGFRLSYDETTISIVKNNLIVNPGGKHLEIPPSVEADVSHNLQLATVEEAGFINGADHNYRLKADSPAVDAGINLPEVVFDYDDISRPQGALPDAGAHEWFAVDDGQFVEMLQNGTFEDASVWMLKPGGLGKFKCNKPDKTVAYEGECAYQMKGGAKTTLTQKLDAVSINSGDLLRLKGYIRGKSIVDSGSIQLSVKLVFASGQKQKYKAAAPGGSYDYTEVFNLFPAEGAVTSLKVTLKYSGAGGKILADNISFGVKTALERLPLP
jgi:hypothetical protein